LFQDLRGFQKDVSEKLKREFMEQDIEDIESQTIYKETLHEETPEFLHNGKRPVILKVCYVCIMHVCISKLLLVFFIIIFSSLIYIIYHKI
jgi:hypothetical protein